jgi:hypothetical protein
LAGIGEVLEETTTGGLKASGYRDGFARRW